MRTDPWRHTSWYRALVLTRRHSRACRSLEARELLLAVERSLLRASALEGPCPGMDGGAAESVCTRPACIRCPVADHCG